MNVITTVGTTFAFDETAARLTEAYTDQVVIERPEIGPPNTMKPDWILLTASRMARLLQRYWHRTDESRRVPPDTLAFALTTLAQILPPSAPPPLVSERGEILQLQWEVGLGNLELEVFKPNEITVVYLGHTWKASNEFSEITDKFWEWFPQSTETPSPLADEILTLHNRASVDPDCVQTAKLAVRDASSLARR